MARTLLLAGVLLVLYVVAVLAGDRVASTRPMVTHSRAYGLVSGAVGGVLIVVALGLFATR
ncbi:MAG TPA: hypothetical protein VM324_15775 [Egibacteraceae bacterium]|nr:hypothetical protein [Egibacteraceae bacterium]